MIKFSKVYLKTAVFSALALTNAFYSSAEEMRDAKKDGIVIEAAAEKPPVSASSTSKKKKSKKKKANTVSNSSSKKKEKAVSVSVIPEEKAEKQESPRQIVIEEEIAVEKEETALDSVIPAEDEKAELAEIEEKIADEIAEAEKEEKSENVQEEEAAKPILTEIGGIKVSASDWSQSMIRKYMGIYTTERGKLTLKTILSRGSEYRTFIRKRLQEENMPIALEYLPVVESEYSINATSRSGAKGLWQFMENSIKPYLIKNDWIDERLDPWKSTEAAIKKLKANEKQFNEWALALAAYNCGAGLMGKIVKENPESDYWKLAEEGFLKNQTTHYLPKLLAITELCENPEKYSLELPNVNESITEYDYVETRKPVNLSKLAKEIGLEIKNIKKLNPSMIRNVTPPGAGYPIRVPIGMKEIASNAAEKVALEMADGAILFVEHKIEKGDTLWAISRMFGCTVADLCDLNGISDRAILKLGKTLYIPMK